MAFSFGSPSIAMTGGAAGGAGGLTQGEDLQVIQTEGLGFLSIAGDAKVQLTQKWSPPPSPTASLLSIASRKGLVAAAGPDSVHVATTEAVRKAFEAAKTGDSEVRPFEPQASLPLPFRISQLAFTADEQYLILSAESGGGLAVYDVQALMQGSAQAAFELSTNGETLRQLAPNPMPELSAYCAVVTNDGNLMMANLKDRVLVTGANGPTLRTRITCAAWSSKGKQLVAGGADGAVQQMAPDGADKGHIPKPSGLGDCHVGTVVWLENHTFLVVHTATDGQNPSAYHIVNRQQPAGGAPPSFVFHKLADPVEPFGSDKVPHHSVLRLRGFPPNLDDLLVISSTATDSIGLVSRSRSPLDAGKPAEKVTNVFTTTELADDSKRAQLPMSEDLMDTYAVGTAMDLSSKDRVYKPIPTDEIELSPGPLPGLWVLNNEGVLASWWVVYNESIRSGTTYPGLAVVDGSTAAQTAPSSGQLPTAVSSPSAKAPAFGAPSTAAPAFGASPGLGAKPSPWSAGSTAAAAAPSFGSSPFGGASASPAPSFGSPSFGQPAFGAKPAAPAFGQSSSIGGLGAKPSPWAAGSAAGATPAFGQSGFSAAGDANSGKVFGSSTASSQSVSGGFANFASKGGFASFAASKDNSGSIFGKPSGGFVSGTPDVSMETDTAFPPPASKTQGGSALGPTPFVLGTTFKADPKAADSDEKPEPQGATSVFDSGFGSSLEASTKTPAAAETDDGEMDVATPRAEQTPASIFSVESTTPTTTPAPRKFIPQTLSPSGGSPGLFAHKSTSSGFAGIFGAAKPATRESPKPAAGASGPVVKEEQAEDKGSLAKIPEAPLPPITTSKAAYPLGDSSASSSRSSVSPLAVSNTPPEAVGTAPLPPDFVGKPATPVKTAEPAPSSPDAEEPSAPEGKQALDDAPLPPDFTSSRPSLPQPPTPPVPESSEDGEASGEESHVGERRAREDEEDEEEGEDRAEDEDEDVDEDEDEDEDEGEDEDETGSEVASEGSGVDVTKDLSPVTTGPGFHTPGYTPQSSFAGMAGSTFSAFPRPDQDPPHSLFGELSWNAPPLFPKLGPSSPRSPSPVRSAVPPSLLRPENSRSVSAPGMASQALGKKTAQQQTQPTFAGTGRSSVMVDPNVELQRRMQAKRDAEAAQVLVDPEDEGIQQILHSDVEASTHLDEFVAVDSQLPPVPGGKIEAGCELLWRDINRMVDHLGLNSRSLQSYIKGHSLDGQQRRGRTKEDLEDPDDWVMVEAEDLAALVDGQLTRELDEGRVQNVEDVHEAIRSLSRDLTKLRAKEEDMRRIVMSHVDPDQVTISKSLPLSAEQATQQNELRRAHANFSKLLSEAEQSLTMLRAKFVSASGASGKANAPTVEAVIRTINKMTSMAEKRSADVDMLENQMRKLRLGPAGLGSGGSPGPRSREGSPFVPGTPQRRSLMLSPEAQRRSLMFSPEVMRHSLASSVASYGGGVQASPPRKKLSMYSEEERKAARKEQLRRKGLLSLLRSRLEQSGPNVSRLGDDY